jgi:ABC-type transport system involved in multi-copper enzyme maturation permease subunit
MSEATLETAPPTKLPLPERLRRNPVLLKELRSRMRGSRAFILITIYLGLLSLLVGGVYLVFVLSEPTTYNISQQQVFGKTIFGLVVWVELLLVSFVAPALTSGAISSEREHQTYDLLRTTLLPARSLVLGKFSSGLVFILLLLFAGLPLQSLAFLFGGVASSEFVIATLLLVVTAIAFCATGVFFSSFLSRTLVSTVLSYAFAILLVFGLPMLMVVVASMVGQMLGTMQPSIDTITEIFLLALGYLAVAVNPLATAIATEVLLLDQQTAFLWIYPLPNGPTLYVISPWIPYVIFYLAVSLILLWVSVRRVRRVEK